MDDESSNASLSDKNISEAPPPPAPVPSANLTSADYYFDSYSHFGIISSYPLF